MFASFAGQRAASALARASELAERFGTSLVVLLVSWDGALTLRSSPYDERWYEPRPATVLVGVHDIENTVTTAELARRRNALAIALETVSLSYETVIDSEPDPAEAVLAAARERDADLVVVGVPRRTWLDSLLHPTAASRVLASAKRSVLLAPIDHDARGKTKTRKGRNHGQRPA